MRLPTKHVVWVLLIGSGLLMSYVWFGAVQPPEAEPHVREQSRPAAPPEPKKKKKSYDQPDEAQRFYAMQRVPEGRQLIPVQKYAEARQHMDQMARYSAPLGRLLHPGESVKADVLWSPLGPGNIGGRTRALVIDPDTPTTMYAAGVAGGVWKTTDGGSTWSPMSDQIANLAVVALAMDPTDSSTLYAGTGEGVFNFDAVRGDGIFKTTDGGLTWVQLSETADDSDFHYVGDLVVSPNNPQHVYAATRTGVWRSQDGGATWARVLNPDGSNSRCLDLAIRTDQSPDALFAACGSFSVQGGVHRSTDGGTSWTEVLTEAGMGRTALALAPSNQDVVYALAASTQSGNYEDGLHAVFRSTDGGATWTARVRNTDPVLLNTLLLSNPSHRICSGQFLSQGWYDNALAVDPLDEDVVWAGGIDLFRSGNGGADWGIASLWWTSPGQSEYVHADQHVIAFHPEYNGTSNRQMFVGNDGGLFRTSNPDAAVGAAGDVCTSNNGIGVSWTSLNNGYAVTQFYHGVAYPDGLTFFGGTQDNGTIRDTDDGDPNNWGEIWGGDGGYVAVDPTNTQVVFVENTRLSILKSTNGGASFSSATLGISESSGNFLFIAPFVMNPGDPQNLWTGGHYLWRTTNQGASWSRASAQLMGTGSASFEGSVSAIAVAPTDPDYVLAGLSNGFILRSQTATTASSSTAWDYSCPAGGIRPRSGYVSWLAFDPNDENVAYATYATFGGYHVYKSTDAGACWTPIDQRGQPDGIPDIPVHSLVVDPTDGDRLFVGTDLGLFVTTDGGATWAVENGGFANTVVEALDLRFDGGDLELFAFTHGRGVFETTVAGSSARYANVRVLLEGAYAGGQAMRTDLNSGGSLAGEATSQPYAGAPWNYAGAEGVAAGFFAAHPQVVDWVLVELRTGDPASPPMTVVARRAAFLLSDGRVVDTDGSSKVRFDDVAVNEAYVVVRHRNHLALMSPAPVALDAADGPAGAPYQHNFTTAASQAYGDNAMSELETGVYGLWGGDYNSDGQVTTSDFTIFNNAFVSAAAGYEAADGTLDGQVTTSDFTPYQNNFTVAAQSQVPAPQ